MTPVRGCHKMEVVLWVVGGGDRPQQEGRLNESKFPASIVILPVEFSFISPWSQGMDPLMYEVKIGYAQSLTRAGLRGRVPG